MRKSFKLALAALPLALLAWSTPANAALVAGGVVAGGGVIAPCLPGDGTPTLGSHYSFSGSVTFSTGSTTLAANGDDLVGSLALGAGTVNLTSPVSASGAFVRVGAVVVAAVADPGGVGAAAGVFAFTPNPVQVGGAVCAYSLLGVGAGVLVP